MQRSVGKQDVTTTQTNIARKFEHVNINYGLVKYNPLTLMSISTASMDSFAMYSMHTVLTYNVRTWHIVCTLYSPTMYIHGI